MTPRWCAVPLQPLSLSPPPLAGSYAGGAYVFIGSSNSDSRINVTVDQCVFQNNTGKEVGGLGETAQRACAIDCHACCHCLHGRAGVILSGINMDIVASAVPSRYANDSVAVTGCTVTSNTGQFGGGMFLEIDAGALRVASTVVTGNVMSQASGAGGGLGIAMLSGNASASVITNCTITGNVAAGTLLALFEARVFAVCAFPLNSFLPCGPLPRKWRRLVCILRAPHV